MDPYLSTADRSQMAPLSVGGTWSFQTLKGRYKLKPVDVEGHSYKAGVKLMDEKKFHLAELKLVDLQIADFSHLSTNLFKQMIEVSVQMSESDTKKFTVILHRKAAIAPALPERPLSDPFHGTDFFAKGYDFFSLGTTLDLAGAIRKGKTNAFTDLIENELVRRFQNAGLPQADMIREVVAPLVLFSEKNRFSIVHKLVSEIEKDPLDSHVIVCGLKDAFKSLARGTYKKIVSQGPRPAAIIWGEFQKRPVFTFSGNQLLKILRTLHQKLPAISGATTAYLGTSDNVIYLEAIVAIIELAVMAQVEGVERVEFHKPIYEALDAADLDPNLAVAHTACMGKQLWTHIPDDETKLHALVRHTIHFGKFLFNLYKIYEDTSLSPLADAFSELREALKFQDKEESWFKMVFSLQNTILGENVRHLRGLKHFFDLSDLAKAKGKAATPQEKEAAENVKFFQTHNPFFVRSLVLILEEVIGYYVEDDPETGKDAILLLQKICTDNFEDKRDEGLFHVHIGAYRTIKQFTSRDIPAIVDHGQVEARDKSYARQLKEEIFNTIMRISATHPHEDLRRVAIESARNIHSQDPSSKEPAARLEFPPYVPVSFPNALFEEVIRDKCPWQLGLRKVRERFYEDYQLKEFPYHVDMEAETLPDRKATDVEKQMTVYLDPAQKDGVHTILLSGVAGSGKTLTAKKVIDGLWRNGGLQAYVPLYIQLGTSQNPRDALNEFLEKNELKPYLNFFKEGKLLRFFVWVDGIDENPMGMKINWPEALGAKEWKNSKFMYSIRSDIMDKDNLTKPKFCYPDGETPAHFRHLSLRPFNLAQRTQFFEKFISIHGVFFKIEWTSQEFEAYLKSHPNLENAASNPLLIRVTAITLPRIVEKNKRAGKSSAEIVDYQMLDAYFCYMVAREQHRQRSSYAGLVVSNPLDYLAYALEAASAIYEYSKKNRNSLWMPQEYAKQCHPELFNDDPLTKIKQRCSSLVLNNGCIGFYHSLYFDQLLQLLGNPYRRQELQEHLREGSYEFESLFY